MPQTCGVNLLLKKILNGLAVDFWQRVLLFQLVLNSSSSVSKFSRAPHPEQVERVT